MSDEPVYVRYVYLTPKGLAILEALNKSLIDLDLHKFKNDQEIPPPPDIEWYNKAYPDQSEFDSENQSCKEKMNKNGTRR